MPDDLIVVEDTPMPVQELARCGSSAGLTNGTTDRYLLIASILAPETSRARDADAPTLTAPLYEPRAAS